MMGNVEWEGILSPHRSSRLRLCDETRRIAELKRKRWGLRSSLQDSAVSKVDTQFLANGRREEASQGARSCMHGNRREQQGGYIQPVESNSLTRTSDEL